MSSRRFNSVRIRLSTRLRALVSARGINCRGFRVCAIDRSLRVFRFERRSNGSNHVDFQGMSILEFWGLEFYIRICWMDVREKGEKRTITILENLGFKERKE